MPSGKSKRQTTSGVLSSVFVPPQLGLEPTAISVLNARILFVCRVRVGEPITHPAITPKTTDQWNGLKIFANAQFACEMPLQVGDAKPWPAQPPLSRATDHIAIRVM